MDSDQEMSTNSNNPANTHGASRPFNVGVTFQHDLYDLGEAVAVDVTPDTSTLLVTVSRDAITEGDLVAIRGVWKEAPAAQNQQTADAQKDEPSQTASLTAPAR